jgi:preprotein translocase subunit SecD
VPRKKSEPKPEVKIVSKELPREAEPAINIAKIKKAKAPRKKKEVAEADILEKYLPAKMSEEELITIIKEIIVRVGAKSPAEMGKVMGVASKELAGNLQNEVVRQLIASTGAGTTGQQAAQNLEIHLRNGALPVDVSVAGSGSVSATLGDHFKLMCLLAGILALITVGIVVYYRYREPAIVLPMVCINASEIIILLGICVFTIQLDLATIAGLIAVLGTGIDQLIIITDEILHEGKVPSPNVYQKRLSRALGIIVASAATVVIAMLPLALMDLSSLRGFAIITILGVLIGVTITRPAYGRIIMAILSK